MTDSNTRDPIERHRAFDTEAIQRRVRWCVTCRPSCRDLAEMMAERGINVVDSAVRGWVSRNAPEFRMQWQRVARAAGSCWCGDAKYVKIKAEWHH